MLFARTLLSAAAARRRRNSAASEPLRIVNSYGLFAVMTTTREEIIVEGSNDGVTWQAYEFPYKPGDVCRAPPIVAPYQPRLDWQMWFAALGSYQQNRWFVNFMVRLLAGRTQCAAPAGAQSLSGRAAEVRPRQAVPLPVHSVRRSGMVEPRGAGDLFSGCWFEVAYCLRRRFQAM